MSVKINPPMPKPVSVRPMTVKDRSKRSFISAPAKEKIPKKKIVSIRPLASVMRTLGSLSNAA